MTGDHDATAQVVLGRTRDVERLLEAPDPVVEQVLGDSRLRRALAEATVRQRRGAWRETVVDRGRLREGAWLDRWWLPACSTAELRLLATVELPARKYRVRLGRRDAPASVAAAILLLDVQLLADREHGGHVIAPRHFVLQLQGAAHEAAVREGLVARPRPRVRRHDWYRVSSSSPSSEHPMLQQHGPGWWHGGQ